MGRADGILIHPLPRQSWPAKQKEKLEQLGAINHLSAAGSVLSQQVRALPPGSGRNKLFGRLTQAVRSLCMLSDFDGRLSTFRDMKLGACPEGLERQRRAVSIGYDASTVSRGAKLFPIDSPVPAIQELRSKRVEALLQASFLFLCDGGGRVFNGSGLQTLVQKSLDAMGAQNFALLDSMKAFQTSSQNHVKCQMGLLTHLSFIYQCEIRDDSRITLSVIWVKRLQEDEEEDSDSQNGSTGLRFCKAPIESFDLSDPLRATKLLAWLQTISLWALEERFDAVQVAQQLDEGRHRRFQQANIALLEDFGANLSTSWLSDRVLNTIPAPNSFQRRVVIAAESPLRGILREPPKQPPPKAKSTLPPQTLSWKGLIPSHKLAGTLPKDSERRNTKHSRSSPIDTPSDKMTGPFSRSISAERHKTPKRRKTGDLAERLGLMTVIYDNVAKSSKSPVANAGAIPSPSEAIAHHGYHPVQLRNPVGIAV